MGKSRIVPICEMFKRFQLQTIQRNHRSIIAANLFVRKISYIICSMPNRFLLPNTSIFVNSVLSTSVFTTIPPAIIVIYLSLIPHPVALFFICLVLFVMHDMQMRTIMSSVFLLYICCSLHDLCHNHANYAVFRAIPLASRKPRLR